MEEGLENVLYKTQVLDDVQEFVDFISIEPNAYNLLLMTAPDTNLGYVLRIEASKTGASISLQGLYDSKNKKCYNLNDLGEFVRDYKPENSFPNDEEVDQYADAIREVLLAMFDREFVGNPENLPHKGRYQLMAVSEDDTTLSEIQCMAKRMGRYDQKFSDPLTLYVLKQHVVVINQDIASERQRLEVLISAVESAILQDDDEGINRSYQFNGARPKQARAHPTPVPHASSTYIPGLDDEIIIPDDEITLGDDERLWLNTAMSGDIKRISGDLRN
tara:strand:- start:2251 stop:3075 length:825 start_codon:yes stop_codon:yes gene_type:complete